MPELDRTKVHAHVGEPEPYIWNALCVPQKDWTDHDTGLDLTNDLRRITCPECRTFLYEDERLQVLERPLTALTDPSNVQFEIVDEPTCTVCGHANDAPWHTPEGADGDQYHEFESRG